MVFYSYARSNVLTDLFNLPSLPDKRRITTMTNDLPHDFYLLDGNNSKISQIINKWIFGKQMPDGNEGFGVKIPYLEHAYGIKHYVVDRITGNINTIHDDSIQATDFFSCLGPFNLKRLEFGVCRVADHHNGKNDLRLGGDRRWTTPNAPAPYSQPSPDCCDHSTYQKI